METPAPSSPALSPGQLAQAPHRIMFFVGASNVLLAMLWWAGWLLGSRWWPGAIPQPETYAGWLHAFVMQYQMLASFIFGFLLTVFPRWMGLRDVDRWRYVPVGLGLFGGQLATLLGAIGWDVGIVVGLFMTVAGWLAALITLAPMPWREKGKTWHARSCFAGLALGLVGLLCWVAFVMGASPIWAFASIKIGTFGFLAPVYLSVAHRMFPFFAGNVVSGYKPWRPFWVLAALWAMLAVHLGLELVHAYGWLWMVDVPMFLLACALVVKWWPVGPKPALLAVLFLGLAWLPIALLLYSAQSIGYLLTGVYSLGRAPAHALFVGFFGSILVAMVTRVTQGHSGRALVMPKAAWFAFGAIQWVTLTRIGAELADDVMAWQAVAAVGWLLAMAPWVARIGRIYLSPRADGKPG